MPTNAYRVVPRRFGKLQGRRLLRDHPEITFIRMNNLRGQPVMLLRRDGDEIRVGILTSGTHERRSNFRLGIVPRDKLIDREPPRFYGILFWQLVLTWISRSVHTRRTDSWGDVQKWVVWDGEVPEEETPSQKSDRGEGHAHIR